MSAFRSQQINFARQHFPRTSLRGKSRLMVLAMMIFAGCAASAAPVQQAYVKASNTGASDQFGYAIAISGDTMVVGAPAEDSNATGINGSQSNNSSSNSGAVFIFVRSGTTWSQQAYLKASNTGAEDQFGAAVAISGDTVVIGAPREDSNVSVINGNQTDNSFTDAGAAYVFTRSGTTWSQQAYLKPSNTGAGDLFGWTVSVSGNTVVVGSPYESSSATGINGNQASNSALEAGASYVFARNGTTWTQQAYLKASNTGAGDYFGWSAAVSGDTVVIGAIGEASSATGVNGNQGDNGLFYSGAAYVFARNGTNWTQQAFLKASNTGGGDVFGAAVAVAGDTAVVGAIYEASSSTGVNGDPTYNSAPDSGAAYVFGRNGTNWSQQAYLKASNTGAGDHFGTSVAVSGSTVVIGADGEASNATGLGGNQSNNSAASAGAAYAFVRAGGTWSQQAYLKASNTGAGDFFGDAVGVSGDTAVVAAFYEASNATGINGTQSNNSAQNSGAAYVFSGVGLGTQLTVGREGSNTVLRFDAKPGLSYRLQRATNILGSWTTIATSNSPVTGLLEYRDTNAISGRAFYRAVQP